MGAPLILGPKGTALIHSFEKLCLASYPDEGGVWTIGWGHTGPGVGPGQICTVAQADAWFTQDTQAAVAAVNASVWRPLSQEQFDALVAFTFNVGAGAEAHSTLCRLVNAGDMAGAANEFGKWNHVNGVVSAGLTRRRQAERDLFVSSGL